MVIFSFPFLKKKKECQGEDVPFGSVEISFVFFFYGSIKKKKKIVQKNNLQLIYVLFNGSSISIVLMMLTA